MNLDLLEEENRQLLLESMIDTNKAKFDMLRDCLDIIKRCSSTSDDLLENFVNKYERVDNQLTIFLQNVESASTVSESEQTKEDKEQFEKTFTGMNDAFNSYTNIRFMVENLLSVTYCILIDVLDGLR